MALRVPGPRRCSARSGWTCPPRWPPMPRPTTGGRRSSGSGPRTSWGPSGRGLVTEVRLVEVLGSEQHVYFWLDATPAAQATAAAAADEPAEAGFLVGSAPNGMARIDPHTPVKPGGRVTLTVDPARLYFF